MRTMRHLLLALLLAITGPAFAQSRPLPPPFEQLLRDYEKAWTAKDLPALAALFAADGMALPNGQPPAQGAAAIMAAYERGAGVALWRVEARDFSWLPKLYDWWAEMERIEPIQFTFNLYIPPELKYAALDLREATPQQVEEFIKANAPRT